MGSVGGTPAGGVFSLADLPPAGPRRERRSVLWNCDVKMLAEGSQPARLETRTKESNMYASWWVSNPRSASNLTLVGTRQTVHHRPTKSFCERFECEHTCWDPKDGELCLSRAKPEETLVEARRCADVQIAFRTWV